VRNRFARVLLGEARGAARGVDIDGDGLLADDRLYQLVRQPRAMEERMLPSTGGREQVVIECSVITTEKSRYKARGPPWPTPLDLSEIAQELGRNRPMPPLHIAPRGSVTPADDFSEA
jgi:hypothetical protein